MSYLELRNGIYHIGDPTTQNGLNCNPYLLIDGKEAVLIDPGSPLDYATVLENIQKLISLDQIKYIVLHHQDPDFCASVPLLEIDGVKAELVTSWRAMTLIQFYGAHLPFYLIEEHQMQLKMASGRTLSFLSTPYLHFAGAFVTYDELTKSLFSSDLFGAFSYNPTLFADDQYLDKMLSFHEHYMPSNAVLRPVMDLLELYEIDAIFPQHGAIINANVPKYIEALKQLECGSLLAPVKKNLMQSGGYLMVFNEVYKRLTSVYPAEDVVQVFNEIPVLHFNSTREITTYDQDGDSVWNQIFTVIKEKQGVLWISILEPFVKTICGIYDLPLPQVFENTYGDILSENKKLQEINQALDQTIKTANDRLVRCQVTGLYNETFFVSLLSEEFENQDWRELGALVCLRIDDYDDYKTRYGDQEGRTVLNNMAYLLKEEFGSNAVYRMDFADFGLYLKNEQRQTVIEKVDGFRMKVSKSDFFIGNLTISAGIAFAEEIRLDTANHETAIYQYLNLALERLRLAELEGRNKVYFEGENQVKVAAVGKVLLVDPDQTNILVLETFLKEEGIEVISTDNGIDAAVLARKQLPEVIISEVMLQKLDGFGFREKVLANSSTKDIEFIFLSHKKDEESVARALQLGVTHYLQKPYLLVELLGIIKRRIKG